MRYIYLLPAAFLAPVIHEWVKALVSTMLGDPTPRKNGFLTFNPLRYFEPIGFMFVILFGYGWGRPVPTAALHYKNRRHGVILTYMIPVLVSLLLGVASIAGVALIITRMDGPVHHSQVIRLFRVLTLYFNSWTTDVSLIFVVVLANFALVNLNLALINLIPVYPMAANKLLLTFGRPDTIAKVNHYEKPMQIVLVLLLAFGIILGIFWPITSRIIIFSWGLVA